ncbi:MAG: hypothetical protein JW986_05765 [Methanotrichaceae archaeon]|nr:hypothetical protein [Methanotrichaceae archaeon]
MFEKGSRYYEIEQASYIDSDGRRIAYKRRRFLPQGASLPLLQEIAVVEGDRLDLMAGRVLGNAEGFWRICDANDCMNPRDLARPGDRLRIPGIQI